MTAAVNGTVEMTEGSDTSAAQDPLVHLARARLAAELDWLRVVLAERVEQFRAGRRRSPDAFLGFTIDDAEVDRLLIDPVDLSAGPDSHGADQYSDVVRAARLRADDAARAVASSGYRDGLERIAECFSLDPNERIVLLLAAAPDLDSRFETLCAYLQDDISRRRPSIDLALKVLGRSLGERWEAGRYFDRAATLLRNDLVRVEGDGPRLSRSLGVDDRIVDELLDRSPPIEARLAGWVTYVEPVSSLDVSLAAPLESLVRRWCVDPRLAVLDGRGAADAASALAARFGGGELNVHLGCLVRSDQDVVEATAALRREAALRQASVIVADGEVLLPAADIGHRAAVVRDEVMGLLAAPPTPTMVVCAGGWPDGVLLETVRMERHTVDVEAFAGRRDRWSTLLAGHGLQPTVEEVDAVAAMFALAPREIERAAAEVRWAAASEAVMARGYLCDAARRQLAHGLGGLARRVPADAGWEDLVLAPATGRQLQELATVVRSRHLLADTRTVALRSRGLSFLFAGPSGTGKSLTASVLAAELGLDLYSIDLATVVSKYIGETEKQLRKVFDAARSSNAILFFDEADALFGKRSDVSDAHDRYANIEVAYLLQQMEAYDGIAILATNLSGNIDDAFARRMHQVVEFSFPDARLRERLWQVMMRGARVSNDVDMSDLAQRFELAGGNIRNAVVHARLLAASVGTPISRREVTIAVAREYQKLGKHPSQTEFGAYFGEVLELLGGS